MGVMDQPVQDGIGQGRIADLFMPVIDGQLTGDEGWFQAMAILEYLE